MILPFNLKKIKEARRLGSPEVFQPPVARGDPYKRRQPGDGQGNTLNKPGDEGLAGSPPESTGYGTKERRGYPTGISAFEDIADKSNDYIPSDKDPDNPFSSESMDSNTQYGTGLVTDYGIKMHDNYDAAVNPSIDDALGIHETVVNKMNNNKDKASPYYNMQKSRPLFSRIKQHQKG